MSISIEIHPESEDRRPALSVEMERYKSEQDKCFLSIASDWNTISFHGLTLTDAENLARAILAECQRLAQHAPPRPIPVNELASALPCPF